MTRHKINTPSLLTPVIFVVFFTLSLSSPARAMDYIFEQQVVDPTVATDVCPNIPGVQDSIPSGMQLDGSGNCYTPTPPPPVTTDLCTNLDGAQTVIPSGYYRTTAGNCYVQPTPPAEPVDVCPNIDAVQITVPDGYFTDIDGSCVKIPEPADVCPNITGPQATVPDGMVLENDVCYTPDKKPSGSGSTSNQNNTPSTPVKNVPEVLQPIAQTLVNLVPQETKQWLRALPVAVAQTVPYYIFIIVAIVALIPILQAIREAIFVRQLLLLLKRERDVAEQKDNFVSLASHYLRTPLTLMKSGLDTIVSLKELPAETVQPLKIYIEALDANVGQILTDVEQNTALKNIQQPVGAAARPSVWRSGWFWGPIIASIILTAVANFLLVIVGEKEVGITTTFFQFLIAAVAFFILYLGVRNMHLQRRLRDENQILINHEKTIDEARNAFISEATITLRDGIEPVNQARNLIEAAPSSKYFSEGYDRLTSILEKFLLLAQVQTGVDRNLEVFDIHEAVDNLLVTYNTAISAKRLTVANKTTTSFIKQNRLLFNFVLGSLLDNAIKFNKEGGAIDISVEPDKKTLTLKVTDNGIGIENEKLGQLFKPFSRATSAIEFNYEGLGFSLFLDKIIMDYTGGDIAAASAPNEGTQLTISTPLGTHA